VVGSTTITSHSYTLDAEGNRTAQSEFVSGITTGASDAFGYSYDGLNRLTAVTTTSAESFTLDGASNIGSRTGPSATYSYDTSNRLTSDGSSTFTWSDADRLTGRGSDSFGYDPLDRLTSSTVSGTSRTYAYSGDGLLQSRTQGGSTTNLLWDPATAPSRLLQVGSDKIVYGLGPLYAVTGSGTTTFARDGGKSVRAELNGSGALTASFRYKAYGALAQSNGASTPTYLGYAGQLLDPTGLYYMRARWYDSTTARFASRDQAPVLANQPWSINAFSYARANPSTFSDPSGKRAISGGEESGGGCGTECLAVVAGARSSATVSTPEPVGAPTSPSVQTAAHGHPLTWAVADDFLASALLVGVGIVSIGLGGGLVAEGVARDGYRPRRINRCTLRCPWRRTDWRGARKYRSGTLSLL
jgi:RHS repeat-associated protein